ncbi:MAG TPA: ubiquinol-cytochrome C chaperone family protein [Asticcacaulis sp.]|nr:ubiquinol-cytochrome C chaperone family protein [Asticcacaulis sp.]
MPLDLDRLKQLLSPKTLFKPRAVTLTGERLYAQCVTQSRQPVFYLDYGVEDAIGARFELLTFHVGLVINALRGVAESDSRHEQARDTAQALFDAFVGALDNTLREQGTGDLSVGKKMKPLGRTIYTRFKAWDDLWTTGDAAARADYAARTLFAGTAYDGNEAEAPEVESPQPEAFAAYAAEAHKQLDLEDILRGQINWCEIAPVSPAAESAQTA